ncbi:hypothetical protein ACFS5N_17515 [Mucilaginibacter ximonensis]|uniref:Uncharacterized protein n=1 Tax=Mucilaginibacter ximonensis TaxID=538021 RepID=A0ABW5YGB3_9SPHI
MAKRENVSTFPRKGKPSGSEKDLDNLNDINDGIDEVSNEDIDIEQAELRHTNRHLHKGEDVARFTDRDDDADEE